MRYKISQNEKPHKFDSISYNKYKKLFKAKNLTVQVTCEIHKKNIEKSQKVYQI